MSRVRYLVSYDISHPQRLRRVAKTVEGYGVRLQFSLFECPLDDLRLARLRAAIHAIINHEEDQVLFVSLGPASDAASFTIESVGRPYLVRTRVTIL